jgi:type IV pilus assembly protein PilM
MAPVTSIEFTDVQCKIVSAERSKNKLSIRHVVRVPLPKNDDVKARIAERTQLLKDALKSHKIKPAHAQVVIPKNYVMARMVTLPSVEDKELNGMARFEAERHIPFNAERHIVAHHVLAKLGVQGSQVLLAAVDQPNAEEYVEICQKAGYTVDTLRVSSISSFNAFAHAEPAALENRVVTIINVGKAYTDLTISNNGLLSFTRGCSLGIEKLLAELAEAVPEKTITIEDLGRMDALEPQNFFRPSSMATGNQAQESSESTGRTGTVSPTYTEDLNISILSGPESSPRDPSLATMPENKGAIAFTNWLLRLLQEIKRTYEFARREFNCPMIDQIYICGEGAAIRNLPQFLKVNLGIETTIFDPMQSLDVPAKLKSSLDGSGPVYAASVGAIVPAGPHVVDINLLPGQYIEKRANKRQQQSWIISGVMAVAALILAFVYVNDLFKEQADLISFYKEKNGSMKKRVEVLETKKTRLNIIRQFVQDEHGALDVLERVSSFKFIPENVTLSQFSYEKDDQVKIAGYAKSYPNVNEMISALQKTGFFDSVTQDPGSVKPRPLPGRGSEQVYEYAITATLKKREDKKAAGSAASSATAAGNEENTDGAQ